MKILWSRRVHRRTGWKLLPERVRWWSPTFTGHQPGHICHQSYSPGQSRVSFVYNGHGNNEGQKENNEVPAVWSIGVLYRGICVGRMKYTKMRNWPSASAWSGDRYVYRQCPRSAFHRLARSSSRNSPTIAWCLTESSNSKQSAGHPSSRGEGG